MRNFEYWQSRFGEIEKQCHGKGVAAYKEIEEQYRQAQKQLESQISVWYQRFARNNNITMQEARRLLNTRELDELKWDVNEYIKYGQQNAIDGRWMKQLENASARAHISRLEALKLQMQQQVEVAFGNQLDSLDSAMRAVYSAGYLHTAYEIQKGLGVAWSFAGLNQNLIDQVLKRPWAPDGKNFSDRVWANKQKLLRELDTTLTQGVILGRDPGKMINEMSKRLNVSKTAAGRLVMTESAAFASRAQEDCFKELDVEEYEIIATLDSHTSEICQDMDGKVFKMSDREIGVNAPPFHVNCVLPDSVVYAPDAEMLTQSDYSGDVIEVRTANSRCFTVTPNHIMLTARGWVRAKDIVKGDKVIYYCGWDKFITETNPTNNHCVPTIENLFTSFVKDGTVIPATMPTTAEDFKGDAIENGEVNIILVDSFLRDKFNPMQRKFLCDSPLIWTEFRDGEIILPGNGTAARFLVCVGLSSDGIMGGGRVADIFFRSSLTHHELIRFRKRAHYNARLFKTAFNGSCSDAEAPGKFLDAASRFIHGDNFINGEFPPCVRVTDCDSIFFKGSRDWLSADTKGICDFADAFAGIVEFDNVVGINVGFYSGHVYDASSQSTLYYCNGFLSSNCRSTTIPYFDDEWSQGGERAARGEDGKTYYVPADMTYKEWEKTVANKNSNSTLSASPSGGKMKLNDDVMKGLPAVSQINANNDIKKFAEQLIDNLGIDRSNIAVSLKPISCHGFCTISNGTTQKTIRFDEYVLNSDDKRSMTHRLKTAFHESFHLSAHGMEWDGLDASGSVKEAWRSLEETFTESSAHYLLERYGVSVKIAPSYSKELVENLPRLKRLAKYSACSTIQDFGEIAFADRQNGIDAKWLNLSAEMNKVNLAKDYYSQYYAYINNNEEDLFDMFLGNMPGFERYKSQMKMDLRAAMGKDKSMLSNNEKVVYYGILACAMQMVGVK